jgi:ParB-like chromosome segregation protein Spo0J
MVAMPVATDSVIEWDVHLDSRDPDLRDAEQLELLPEEPLRPEYRPAIELADLPPDGALVGPPPERALVASIKRLGLLEPVLLEALPAGGYTVRDGRRRIKAARRAGMATAPALVIACGGLVGGTITVAKHAVRRDNLAAELEAVERFLTADKSERDVASATGLTVAAVRQRARLLGLHPDLLAALVAGRVSGRVAKEAVKLPRPAQAWLAATLDAKGRLTGNDLAEVRRVGAADVAQAIPFAQIAALPAADDLVPAVTAPAAGEDPPPESPAAPPTPDVRPPSAGQTTAVKRAVAEGLRAWIGAVLVTAETADALTVRLPTGEALTIQILPATERRPQGDARAA